ncbi:MAG: hypothetical protein ACREOQ_01870 [Gemmatimonadales bacterium]
MGPRLAFSFEIADGAQLGPHAVELRDARGLGVDPHPQLVPVGPEGADLGLGQCGEPALQAVNAVIPASLRSAWSRFQRAVRTPSLAESSAIIRRVQSRWAAVSPAT